MTSHAAATPTKMSVIGRLGWLRGAFGAFAGILLTGAICHALTGHIAFSPWLIAPMGASAVLIFVLPASPLAQPWAVLGSHAIAVVTSMICAKLMADPVIATALSVGIAIALMSAARCLHPPAGGTAALATLGGPAIAAQGWAFILAPVTLNAVLLVACGLIWHRLTGTSWPHHAAPVPAVPAWTGHIEDEDLDAILEEWDDVLDVSREDLLAVLHAVERRVRDRAG